MSWPYVGNYQLDEQRRAALAEQARVEQVQRDWRAMQEQFVRLVARADAVARRVRAPRRTALTVLEPLTATDPTSVEKATAHARKRMLELSQEIDELCVQDRNLILANLVGDVGSGAQMAKPDRTAIAKPVVPDDATKDIQRAARLLSRLDSELDVPQTATVLVAAVASSPAMTRGVKLDELRSLVDKLNTRARLRRSWLEELEPHSGLADDSGDPDLLSAVASARAAIDADRAPELTGVAAAAKRVRRSREAQRMVADVQQILIEEFARQDCAVVSGVADETDGILVWTNPEKGYAAALNVSESRISIDPVRLVQAGSAPDSDEDQAAIEPLCAVSPGVWAAAIDRGVWLDFSVEEKPEVEAQGEAVNDEAVRQPRRRSKSVRVMEMRRP